MVLNKRKFRKYLAVHLLCTGMVLDPTSSCSLASQANQHNWALSGAR